MDDIELGVLANTQLLAQDCNQIWAEWRIGLRGTNCPSTKAEITFREEDTYSIKEGDGDSELANNIPNLNQQYESTAKKTNPQKTNPILAYRKYCFRDI